MKNRILFFLIVLLGLTPTLALAAPNMGVLDQIVQTFKSTSQGWVPGLKAYATALFWILVSIDFAWHAINQALKGEEFRDLIGGLFRKVMSYGFFYYVLLQADTWMPAILNSFVQASSSVGGVPANTGPSTVIGMGFDAADAISRKIDSLGLTDIGVIIVLGWVMIVVVLAYAVAAGQLLVTMVETYIASSAAVLLLGFGGSKWTLDYVQKVLGYIMGAGIKLFVLFLIIGVGKPLVDQCMATFASMPTMQISDALGPMAVAMVFTFLCFQVPSLAAALLSGSPSMTLGSMMATAATTAAGGVAAGATAIGGGLGALHQATGAGQAIGAASGLASAQMAAGQTSTLGSILGTPGQAAGNLMTEAKNSIKGAAANAGANTVGGRMAESMTAQKQSLQANQVAESPAAPPSPPDGGNPPGGNPPPGDGSSSPGDGVAPGPSTSEAATSSPTSAPASDSPSPAAASAPTGSGGGATSGSTGGGGGGAGSGSPKTLTDRINDLRNAKPMNTVQDAASASAPRVDINHAE